MDLNTRYLIVKGSGGGGLGDRLRSVLTAIIYAKLSGRTLYVDWSDGKLIKDRRNIFYELFQLNNINHVENCPKSDDVFPPVWRGKLNLSLHELYEECGLKQWNRQAVIDKFSFDQTHFDYPQKILVMWEFDQLTKFSGHYTDTTGNALMRLIADQHLNVNAHISDQVKQFRQSAFSTEKMLIAVHIRATKEFMQQKSAVTLRQYVRQIKKVLSKTDMDADIFLATDNSDVEHQLHAAFPGLLCTREKWFANPGDKLHFNEHCPDADKALEDAIIEIRLLADSNYLIYQHNSSFGMIADFFFTGKQENIVKLFPHKGLKARAASRAQALIRKIMG